MNFTSLTNPYTLDERPLVLQLSCSPFVQSDIIVWISANVSLIMLIYWVQSALYAVLSLLWQLMIIVAVVLAIVFPDLSEVGYSYLDGRGSGYNKYGKTKKQLINDIRKARKIGNLPPVYPNGWFALLESSELKPKQAKYVSALGENFAVFRSERGEVHVLDAYCPHLGANIAIGGFVRGDCIECPFHQWQFSGHDGRCVNIPYSGKVPEFARVKHWQSLEVNDFVFVWYHAEQEEPSWRPEPMDKITSGDWWYRGRSEYLINSHIQEIPENGGDIAHLNAIHAPSLVAGSDLHDLENTAAKSARHVWEATWEPHTTAGETHIATMNLRHDLRIIDRVPLPLIGMNVEAKQIGPGYVEMVMHTCIGRLAILQTVTPVEPMLQKVIHRIYCPPHLFWYANIVLYGECIMIERDIMVWNHKTYIDKPLLVKEDRTLARHRRWYSQFYTEHSPRFDFKKDTLDW
ncbi:hypothetical protein M8J76_002690 [Diaphorina citri]|nr:hypothetical protein M8J76_002690 [Diaphorina citri]